jgi:transposase-like protein
MVCPSCRSTALVEIGLKLRDQQVTMHSCSSCDRRWWDKEGETVALPCILELVAAH